MKSNFFLLCSLAPRQQVKLNGHSRVGWRGKVLLCNTSKKKRLKPASFSGQWDSWPGFSIGNLEPGVSQKTLLQAARLFRSELSLLQVQSHLEREKVSGECSMSRAKNWFFHSSWCAVRRSAAYLCGGLVQSNTTGRSVSAWYHHQELLWRWCWVV